MTVEDPAGFIAEHSTPAGLAIVPNDILALGAFLEDGYRLAAKVLHPTANAIRPEEHRRVAST